MRSLDDDIPLIWWAAGKIANIFGYTSREVLGSCFIAYHKCNQEGYYSEDKGKFSTYFFRACFLEVRRWLRDDAMWRETLARNEEARKAGREKEIQVSYAFHEGNGGHLFYWVPEEDSDSIQEVLDNFETQEAAWHFLVRGLDQRRRAILTRRYRDGWTLRQIGVELRITRERVRQLLGGALEQVKTRVLAVKRWAELFAADEERLKAKQADQLLGGSE